MEKDLLATCQRNNSVRSCNGNNNNNNGFVATYEVMLLLAITLKGQLLQRAGMLSAKNSCLSSVRLFAVSIIRRSSSLSAPTLPFVRLAINASRISNSDCLKLFTSFWMMN
uniref:Uncharacterized protein n=1 Tax=Anopheles merus TaxID=30066 RepID=A0A182VKQ0_ANOME